jgi:hypothetical protein
MEDGPPNQPGRVGRETNPCPMHKFEFRASPLTATRTSPRRLSNVQEERRFYKALRLYYISNANVKSGTSAVHETSAWIQELNEYVYMWVYVRTFPEAIIRKDTL